MTKHKPSQREQGVLGESVPQRMKSAGYTCAVSQPVTWGPGVEGTGHDLKAL